MKLAETYMTKQAIFQRRAAVGKESREDEDYQHQPGGFQVFAIQEYNSLRKLLTSNTIFQHTNPIFPETVCHHLHEKFTTYLDSPAKLQIFSNEFLLIGQHKFSYLDRLSTVISSRSSDISRGIQNKRDLTNSQLKARILRLEEIKYSNTIYVLLTP